MNENIITLESMGQAAKAASQQLSVLTTDEKNTALHVIADELEAQASTVLAQNMLDIADAKAKGLSEALCDRLLLTEQRIAALAADTRRVADLPDPVGTDIESRMLPNGI
jgi:glutamate-5-semialdehyde dehydrogenase